MFLVRVTTLLIYRRKRVNELLDEAIEQLDMEGKCCDILNCVCSGDNPTCEYEGSDDDDTETESDEGFHD